MSMSLSATKVSISSKIIGIPSVIEDLRAQCLISNFVSIRVIHRPFVPVNQFTASTRVRL